MAFKDEEKRRAYFREYNKGWYQRHKDRLLEKRRQHDEDLRMWLRRLKSKLRCEMCGENHPACLQFHHREKEEKNFTISNAVLRGTSIKSLINEIKKCDVLCVNCHAKRHWRETHETDSWEEIVPEA